MDTLSLVFKIHQPFYLRTYRFFDIGERHNYYDDYRNKYILKRFSERSYYRANALMGRLMDRYGEAFKISFVFSGNAMDQMQWYMPELLDDFRRLAERPQVELLATDYSCSAAASLDKEIWRRQVEAHGQRLEDVFGRRSKVLVGTQLMYDDKVGEAAAGMGMEGMLTEGAKPVLGWKSPDMLYRHPSEKLKLILRDGVLSEDVSLRFSERGNPLWPFTAEKFVNRLEAGKTNLPGDAHVTLYCNYAVMGEFQEAGSGIFEFFEALPGKVLEQGFGFAHLETLCHLPEEAPVLHVPFTISDMDEEKDLTAFYANELQKDVMENWRKVSPVMRYCTDPELQKDFLFLTGVENLGFMSTKYFTNTPSIRYLNPYPSPYDAYINYMNIWSDFLGRLRVSGWVDEDGNPLEKDVFSEFMPDSVKKAVDAAADAASDIVDSAAEALAEAMGSVGKVVRHAWAKVRKGNKKGEGKEPEAPVSPGLEPEDSEEGRSGAESPLAGKGAETPVSGPAREPRHTQGTGETGQEGEAGKTGEGSSLGKEKERRPAMVESAEKAVKKTVRKAKALGQKALEPDVDKLAEKAAEAMDTAEKVVKQAVRKGAEAVLKAVEPEEGDGSKRRGKRVSTRKATEKAGNGAEPGSPEHPASKGPVPEKKSPRPPKKPASQE